jgi:hypothetical protein
MTGNVPNMRRTLNLQAYGGSESLLSGSADDYESVPNVIVAVYVLARTTGMTLRFFGNESLRHSYA